MDIATNEIILAISTFSKKIVFLFDFHPLFF